MFPDEMHAERFDAICDWLRRWFVVLPVQDAVRRLRDGTLPARALSITFDDGYADNAEVAMPILQCHGLTATFFVSTGHLDGGRMWNDTIACSVRGTRHEWVDFSDLGLPGVERMDLSGWDARRNAVVRLLGATKYLGEATRASLVETIAQRLDAQQLPTDLMMRSEQVQALRDGGMRVGAHTVSHPILGQLPRDLALLELKESRSTLEALLGEPVTVFAYPNGKPHQDYTAESVGLVREAGFDVAVSTEWGSADASVDPLQVPRFSPWDRTQWRYGLRLMGNLRRGSVGVGSA
jgi:peptidoglycan/xylan/chitin deacetylase (PgdA/CDA1 family)